MIKIWSKIFKLASVLFELHTVPPVLETGRAESSLRCGVELRRGHATVTAGRLILLIILTNTCFTFHGTILKVVIGNLYVQI